MNAALTPDPGSDQQKSSMLLDVLIRAALIFALAALCYQIFAPFLTLMVWALILAVAMYPLHQVLARTVGGRQGLAATLIALTGAVLIVAPTAVLMGSLADSVQQFVHGVQNNTLQIPPPRPGVETWPIVGDKIHAFWSKAHTDLPALVQSMQPKIGDLAKAALGFVAGVGGGLLMFLASFLIAGVIMAFGAEGARSSEAIFARIMSPERAPEFVKLSTATIRAVAQGVIGVALIQAIAVGVTLLVAQVPLAGVLAVIVLVLGIAQIPALLVTAPGHRLHLDERRLRHRCGRRLLGRAVRRGHRRQLPEAADAGPRRRRADAGDPAGRAGRHGGGRHPRSVRRRGPAGAGLPDLHGLGAPWPGARVESQPAG